MTSPAARQPASPPPPRVEELSPGVFGYVQMDGSWGLNNTGFIVGGDGVVAIDACFTERRTRWLMDAIRARAESRPIRTLIDTHHHGDHTFGNYLFLPEATIIGHARCREGILEEKLAAHALFPGVDWGRIELAPPTVTFESQIDVWAGDLKLELIFVGPAHTTNDIVVWIPERGVLLAGDVIFNEGTPFALAGSIGGWLEALDRLRALGAATIVPGHGAICGREAIENVAGYLEFVLDAARKGHAAGREPLDVAREMDLGRFAGWLDPERFVVNLHRAYSELRGEPPAVRLSPKALQDMIAFNGGSAPRCLA